LRIHEHVRIAQLLADWIDASPDFERMAPTPFSLVCLRARPQGMDDEAPLDVLNERLLNRINATGRFFLSHTRLQGKYTLRIAIGNIRTTELDIRELWDTLQQYTREEETALG